MFTNNDEAAYIQRRIDASLDMARAATSECARIAHEALAEHYGTNLLALRHHPKGPAIAGVFRSAAGARNAPRATPVSEPEPVLSTC